MLVSPHLHTQTRETSQDLCDVRVNSASVTTADYSHSFHNVKYKLMFNMKMFNNNLQIKCQVHLMNCRMQVDNIKQQLYNCGQLSVFCNLHSSYYLYLRFRTTLPSTDWHKAGVGLAVQCREGVRRHSHWHWSRASMCWNIFMLLHQLSYTIMNGWLPCTERS